MVNVESGGEGVGPGNPGESELVGSGAENVGNVAEISDLTQEAGNELGETQESGEISPETELENEYDQGLKLNERINKLKEQTDKDRAEIQKVRNELGSERKDIPADATIQELIDKQEELAKRMDALEAKALGAPEGGKVEGARQEIEGLQSLKAENRDFAKEMKEARQQFVEKFIKDSIDYANRHWAAQFAQAENGSQARDLVAKKLAYEITKETQEFVERGGNFEIGWHGSLECARFRTPDAQSKMFITGFNLKVGGLMEGAATEVTEEEEEEEKGNDGAAGNSGQEMPLAA